MNSNVQVKSKRPYSWGIFISIVLIIITVCVSLPFLIANQSKKYLLYGLIGTILLILLLTIGLMEWFRRKSQTKRRYTDDPWVSQTLHTRTSYNAPTVSTDVGNSMSVRSSWIHWIPKKIYQPSAPQHTDTF